MEAQSLLPVLAGENPESGRELVFAEHGRDGILDGTDFMTMVRSQDFKLVHFIDHPDGQLFDLKNDPKEEKNLWDNPDFSRPKQELLDALREWHIRSQIDTRHWQENWR